MVHNLWRLYILVLGQILFRSFYIKITKLAQAYKNMHLKKKFTLVIYPRGLPLINTIWRTKCWIERLETFRIIFWSKGRHRGRPLGCLSREVKNKIIFYMCVHESRLIRTYYIYMYLCFIHTYTYIHTNNNSNNNNNNAYLLTLSAAHLLWDRSWVWVRFNITRWGSCAHILPNTRLWLVYPVR